MTQLSAPPVVTPPAEEAPAVVPEPVRESHLARVAFLVAVGMVLVLVGAAVGGLAYLQGRIDANIERFPDPFAGLTARPEVAAPVKEPVAAPVAPPVTFLVLGSDSRISAGDPEQWAFGAQRTDAIMLVQVSGARDAVTVMSLPRDAWVPIPGYGDHKLNAAFSFGGPALTVETIESLTGTRIDHVAVTDFESFATLTDELDGVAIALSQPLTAGGTTVPPGRHTLDGEQALKYVRERYTVPGGDFGRMQRQQNWMRGILFATITRDVLTNPTRLWRVLETFSESISVDEGLTIEEMRDLALSMRDIRKSGVRFITAPSLGTGWSPDGRQSIVLLDDVPFHRVSEAFADGTVHELLEADPDIARRLGDRVG